LLLASAEETMSRTSLAHLLTCIGLGAAAAAAGGCAGAVDDNSPTVEAALNEDGRNGKIEIPLVVVLWENIGFGGQKREFVRDEPYLGKGWTWGDLVCWVPPSGGSAGPGPGPNGPGGSGGPPVCSRNPPDCGSGTDFNDAASAIGVHPGPDYDSYRARTGHEPTVTVWSDRDFQGTPIRLAAGGYSDLRGYTFNDTISSLRIDDPTTQNLPIQRAQFSVSSFSSIPLVVRLHSAAHARLCDDVDKVFTLIEDSADLGGDYNFNDSVSWVEVLRGPSYSVNASVSLFADVNFGGSSIKTTTIGDWDVNLLGFNDMASSIKIVGGPKLHWPPPTQ
jgi:hypothetical protein